MRVCKHTGAAHRIFAIFHFEKYEDIGSTTYKIYLVHTTCFEKGAGGGMMGLGRGEGGDGCASRRVTLNDPSHLLGQQCFEVLLTSLIFVQKLPQPLGDALLYNVQLVCSALWRCLFTLMIAHLTQQLMKSKEQLV